MNLAVIRLICLIFILTMHAQAATAGRDMVLTAGEDIALMGGSVVTAGQDATLVAGRHLGLSAVADTYRSRNRSWGLSFGFTDGGFTIGGNRAYMNTDGVLFSNAVLGAGRDAVLMSGEDMMFAGANVEAANLYIDAGRDLTLSSMQNVQTVDGLRPSRANMEHVLARAFDTENDSPDRFLIRFADHRVSPWNNRRDWTETTVSRLTAGRDMVLTAGEDMMFAGAMVWGDYARCW